MTLFSSIQLSSGVELKGLTFLRKGGKVEGHSSSVEKAGDPISSYPIPGSGEAEGGPQGHWTSPGSVFLHQAGEVGASSQRDS